MADGGDLGGGLGWPQRPWPGAEGARSAAGTWSDRMSIRQPVILAARRAFWPSRPMASESMRSGTVTLATRASSSMWTPTTWAGLRALATKRGRVVGPRDDVDLLAAQLGHHGLHATAALADRRADRVQALLAAGHGDLAAAAGLTGDGPDLDRAAVDLRHLELEQAAQEALVGAADVDLGALGGAAHLQHVGLHVLADAVVLHGRLLGRGQDGVHALGLAAHVEDDARAARRG